MINCYFEKKISNNQKIITPFHKQVSDLSLKE